MTAFEILLNKFYETIENSEPRQIHTSNQNLSGELNRVIKDLVNTTFKNGHNLSYKNMITELMEEGANLLQNSNHKDWARVKYAFVQNELHVIRKDRNVNDVENLKMRLESML